MTAPFPLYNAHLMFKKKEYDAAYLQPTFTMHLIQRNMH